jgi:hypothetical protein
MNIAESEVPCKIAAKMCGFNEATKKIMYMFTDSYHNLVWISQSYYWVN